MTAAAEPGAPARAPAPAPALPRADLAVVASAVFVTGLGWPGVIGRIPFGLLLKNGLGLPADAVANFWAVGTFAWYLKPLVGLVSDAYPLGGSRRRGYLLAGGAAAALAWLAFAFTPRRYLPFMALMTALNVALVFVSAAAGGLQTEIAQRTGATGRLASLRGVADGAVYVVGGPLAGWLAGRAFGWTAAAGAVLLFALVPVVAGLYREPPAARGGPPLRVVAAAHLRAVGRSRGMLSVLTLIFLFFVAPGFQTPLLYYQQDVLKLSPQLMGLLQLVGGSGWILGGLLYSRLCRRLPLRTLLVAGIVLCGTVVLLYLRYDSPAAAVGIELAFNTAFVFGMVPLYDLGARATPKGSEGFCYALMASAQNIALYGLSDPIGSRLYTHHVTFQKLVWINAGSTLAVLAFLPLVPASLLAGREDDVRP